MNRDPDPRLSTGGTFEEPPWIVTGIVMDQRDPDNPGRVIRTEIDPDDVRQWDELARHLVQGHGGEPTRLLSNELTLNQIRFAHADTHQALAFINASPPDDHAHPEPLDAGEPTGRLASYFPFWRSPAVRAQEDDSVMFPTPAHTGLPHTGLYHVSFPELADWAADQLPRRLTSPETKHDVPWTYWAEQLGVPAATRADRIKTNADRASSRWLASISRAPASATQGTAAARPARRTPKQVPPQARRRP